MDSTTSERGAVFLGPLEISGYYANLERGLLDLHVDARLVTLYPNPFGYTQAQPNPWPAAWAHRIVHRHRVSGAASRLLWGALFVLASVLLLAWSIPRYRTFVFAWGMTLLPLAADLPILRLLGKQVIVVVGHGSEARPPYMSTLPEGGSPDDADTLDSIIRATATTAARMRRLERRAGILIGLPTTAQFLRRPFVDFYALGIPTARLEAPAARPRDGFTIVHVPSKPEVKGTAEIRRVVEELRSDDRPIRYLEVTGRPHHEVLAALAQADLVIDQLWSDIPMAVVGTEAAAMGTPTVIAGYAWDVWRRVLPADEWPPGFVCAPDELRRTVESCLADPTGTSATGARARAFVEARWAPAAVAARFLRVIDGTPDEAWMVDPAGIDYAMGCGADEVVVRRVVEGIVARAGWAALRWPRAREVYGGRVS